MDRTYPSPGFAEPLQLGPPAPAAPAPPAAVQPPGPAPAPTPAWAYEPRGPAGGGGGGGNGGGGSGGSGGSGGGPSPSRGPSSSSGSSSSCSSSGSSLKASLNYGGGHSSQSETDLLHRQNYGTSHQLPGYAVTHHSTGLSGIFDTNMNNAGTNNKESSVMNFLSAIESRTAPATSSGTTLLPQFRAPSWQTGMHSSTATELFVTGALPTTGTFPSTSTLSTYQHPNTFSNRNFTTTPPLTLQDSTFNNTSNGILNPHDPLLQIKTSQGTVPTALSFERLGNSVLSTNVPPQSSTYRSAQESAPHLLQPQFSLLSSPLGGAQQASQAYSSSVFTGSTTSIERVLRECSVIKHHQRPSNTQSIQAQLTGSQHSLPSYFSNASVADFQDTTRQPSLSCNPIGDSTQVSNGGPPQKTSQVSVGMPQSYPSTIPSPSYLPTSKVKNCSTKQPSRSAKTPKPQSVMPPVLKQSYSKSLHNQSSVISGQAQIYSTAQLPSLLSVSQSQNYASTQSHNVPSIVHSQVYTHSKAEKLPPLYKTLTFSAQSQTVTSESQTISYSSDQQQVLSSVTNENYSTPTRDISSVSQPQSYSGHSQGLSTVSQSQVSFSSQSQVLSAGSPSENYTSGQSLTLASSSLPFSSSPQVQNLPASSSTQNYISMHSSQSAQTQGSSSPQSQKFLPTAQSTPFASPIHSQTLQNNRSSTDAKSYTKRKPDSTLYTSSKQEDDFPVQYLQVLQQPASLESPTQRLPDGEINSQDPAYRISKADDRYPQSVIRSNSCLEEQVVGVALQEQEKEERMVNSMTHLSQSIGPMPNVSSHDIKKASNLMQTSQTNTKELNQQHPLLPKVHEVQVQEQHNQAIHPSPQIQIQTNALRQMHQLPLPSSQTLLESGYDLQIFQQSILQANLGQAKASTQIESVPSSQQIVHPFLQMDSPVIQSSSVHSQQQLHPQNSEVIKMDLSESSKPLQHLATKGIFNQPNQHDSKNQFVSLGSMCFPESILLSDERNILSNDDILAATAAACGVTPSDFAKSTSSETLPTIENGDDPKSHFQQSADIRHVTPDFNPLTAMVGKSENLNNISLNGGQITINLSSIPIIHSKNMNLDQKHLESPDQNVTPSAIEEQQQSSDTVNKASSITNESKEDNDIPADGMLKKNQEFVTTNKSVSGESAVSENEFCMASDSGATGSQNKVSLPLVAVAQPGEMSSVKTEEDDQFNPQKKRLTGKGLMKEDDNNSNQKQVKWPPQNKRQNSRGTDPCLPFSPPNSECCHDGYQHQEKMRQKIREVEEKQPEVKTGFIASFLDFLKSGPKQQFSAPAVRMPNRTRRPGTQLVRAPCHTQLPKTSSTSPAVSEAGGFSPSGKIDELKKNFEALPAFSSDDEDSGGCSNDLQKSISTVLTTLDNTSDKKKNQKTISSLRFEDSSVVQEHVTQTLEDSDNQNLELLEVSEAVKASAGTTLTPAAATPDAAGKQESVHKVTAPTISAPENASSADPSKLSGLDLDGLSSDQLAKVQETAAIEGCVEENSDSGGEGQYRERDEFVVKVEDIDNLKVALKTGKEPPAIWKVQKALLQKFVPEIRDGQREFAATNSYLGYFGDAKSKYRRVYVKFIENTNKKEYVRVCSKKPRSHPLPASRAIHSKPSSSSKVPDPPAPKTTKVSSVKSKAKQPKTKAEPPPKKRKKWKQELESSPSDSSPEVHTSGSEEEEFDPPVPSVPRFLNTRAMKETFRSYVELLVSIALDADTMQALEKSEDELLLPHMKKIDGMLNENRRRLLLKLHLDQSLKNALESFPELTIITRDSKAKSGGSISKIKMNGKSYNKKTLRTSKSTTKSQEFAVDPEKTQLYSLYHSLHHYKYHIYLICREEISSVQKKNEDLGQEEIVQLCMKNVKWVEDLFEKFGELLNFVQQKCS